MNLKKKSNQTNRRLSTNSRMYQMNAAIRRNMKSIIRLFETGKFEKIKADPSTKVPTKLSDIPLVEKAEQWGVTITVLKRKKRMGHYDWKKRSIKLGILCPKIYLHELAHAAYYRLRGTFTHTQLQWQEVMAELCAATLYRMFVIKHDENLSRSYWFIYLNAILLNVSVEEACREVSDEAIRIIKYILQ